MGTDNGWGPWFRQMLHDYFWVIIIAILVTLDYVSGSWVVQMVEKLIDKIGVTSL